MPSWPIWKTTSELGSGSVRAIRTIALGRDRAHAGVAVERRALRDAERRAGDVALHDDRAARDLRADGCVRADHQTVIGRDRAAEGAIDLEVALELELSVDV